VEEAGTRGKFVTIRASVVVDAIVVYRLEAIEVKGRP
jgi:hypothetical protein